MLAIIQLATTMIRCLAGEEKETPFISCPEQMTFIITNVIGFHLRGWWIGTECSVPIYVHTITHIAIYCSSNGGEGYKFWDSIEYFFYL